MVLWFYVFMLNVSYVSNEELYLKMERVERVKIKRLQVYNYKIDLIQRVKFNDNFAL